MSAVKESVRPVPESDVPFDQGPPAVQLVAFVELQVRVARSPDTTEVGVAESVAVGAAFDSEQEAVVPPLRPAQDQV